MWILEADAFTVGLRSNKNHRSILVVSLDQIKLKISSIEIGTFLRIKITLF